MSDIHTPDIAEQFLEPEGWRWHSFTREGREIRFGSVFPKERIPDAVVICLPGLSEFGEKYFETARTCLDKNLAFWVLDWHGQGLSGRYLTDPQKRHCSRFDDDVEDLHHFYLEYVKHACVHPDVGRIPVVMLAHSMGANIGMHYLRKYPEIFECAAFSAPMFGLKALEKYSLELASYLAGAIQLFAGKRFAAGQKAWHSRARRFEGNAALSNDPQRVQLHSAWFEKHPKLQVGGVTYGWLYNALKACAAINRPSFCTDIKTPCFMALAGQETVVNNQDIRTVAQRLPMCDLLEFSAARHEILMERDAIRDIFFEKFYAMIKECIIERPETLRPF